MVGAITGMAFYCQAEHLILVGPGVPTRRAPGSMGAQHRIDRAHTGVHPNIPHRWEFLIGILDGNHAGSTPVI